ncbi:TPA: hypothetical protein ACGO9X_001239 [Streptococcus suis]
MLKNYVKILKYNDLIDRARWSLKLVKSSLLVCIVDGKSIL